MHLYKEPTEYRHGVLYTPSDIQHGFYQGYLYKVYYYIYPW